MNFKICLQKYKDGTATLEEQQFVEQELEKFQLLSELHDEQLDDEFLSLSSTFETPVDNFKDVKTALKKRTIKTVLLSTITVLTLTAISSLLIPPLLDKLYYDPEEKILDDTAGTFYNSMSFLSALHLPGKDASVSKIEQTGIGKYDITLSQFNHFTEDTHYYQAEVDKNKLTIDDNFINPANIANIHDFSYGNSKQEQPLSQMNEILTTAQTFPESTKFEAVISFNKDLTMDEFLTLYQTYDLDYSWVAVRHHYVDHPNQNMVEPPIWLTQLNNYSSDIPVGFSLDTLPYFYISEVANQYPELYISEYLYEDTVKPDLTAEVLENYFKQLLQIQLDYPAFHQLAKDKNPIIPSYEAYHDLLMFIDYYGIKTYGVVVSATADQLVEISKDSSVCDIKVKDIELAIN